MRPSAIGLRASPLALALLIAAGCTTQPLPAPAPARDTPPATGSADAETGPRAGERQQADAATAVAAPPPPRPRPEQRTEPSSQPQLRSEGRLAADDQAKPQPPAAEAAQPGDLWARVRSGFALEGQADHLPVRRWTQQFATHPGDLERSLTRARPFLWHIVEQIEQRDMPMELALLPVVESGFDPSARSYMGATGLWQFMPGTADHVGLSRDWWYDGRNDVIASTQAALDYLSELSERYDGDWLLALAAYNGGPARIDRGVRAARRRGVEPTFWNIDKPLETTDYVPKLLALARVMNAPQRYGVSTPTLGDRPRTRVVWLDGQTDLQVAARMLDMDTDALRRLNPGLRRRASAPNGRTRLLVPAARAPEFRQALADAGPGALVDAGGYTVARGDTLGAIAARHGTSVAALRQANGLRGSRIRAGQTLQLPTTTGGPAAAAPSEQPSESYAVQPGDSLWRIGQRYNVSVAALRRANPGLSAALQPGDEITLPGAARPPAPSTYVVERGDSLWEIARANDISTADLRRWNRLGANSHLSPGQELAVDGPAPLPDFYEVERGDSLWSIASRFSMPIHTLRSLNDMNANTTIRPGQRLRLQPSRSSG